MVLEIRTEVLTLYMENQLIAFAFQWFLRARGITIAQAPSPPRCTQGFNSGRDLIMKSVRAMQSEL